MLIEVLAPDAGKGPATTVLEALAERNVDHRMLQDATDAAADVVVVVGDAAFLLEAVRDLPAGIAVLSVSPGGGGVLAEVAERQFAGALRALLAGAYEVETVARMRVEPGAHDPVVALNEAALLPAVGGQFVRHALWVDGELIWRDRGDGLIVATSTGSTAYALAAGGPVVLAGTPVLAVVPVNSSEANGPVVVRDDARVLVTDAASAHGVDLVVDGNVRLRLERDEDVVLTRAKEPARFVRLRGPRFGRILDRLRIERELGPELKEAPPSAKFLYKLLEYEGPLTQQEIVKETQLAARTVRNALGYLTEHGFVAKQPSLRDARQDVYDLVQRVTDA